MYNNVNVLDVQTYVLAQRCAIREGTERNRAKTHAISLPNAQAMQFYSGKHTQTYEYVHSRAPVCCVIKWPVVWLMHSQKERERVHNSFAHLPLGWRFLCVLHCR